MATQILYIGAGTHFQVCRDFQEVKTFVFIDAAPFSDGEHGERPLYEIAQIFDVAQFYGFKLVNSRTLVEAGPSMHVLSNPESGQTVFYYSGVIFYSDPVKTFAHHEIATHIRGCDALVVSGYHPYAYVLDGIPEKTMRLIGYCKTWMGYPDEQDDDELVGTVMESAFATSFFKDFVFVAQDDAFLYHSGAELMALCHKHEFVSGRIRFTTLEDFREHALDDWEHT